MSFHWTQGMSEINQITLAAGDESSSTTASPTLLTAKVSKKGAAQKKGAGKPAPKGAIVGYEIVFKLKKSPAEVTVRLPIVGAFHDLERRTTLRDVRALRKQIAGALDRGFKDDDD